MWTLVEPDNSPGANNSPGGNDRPGGSNRRGDKKPRETLASRLPDFDESVIASALVAPSKHKRPVLRFVACTLLSLMLVAALAAQITYRHLNSISQHDTLRPWLLLFCDYAQCMLPTAQDSNMIVSTRLSIEPHPLYQDVAQMLLSFTNTADFAQPLPAIELAFSDTRGRSMAGRRFKPDEYRAPPASMQGGAASADHLSGDVSADYTMRAGESFTAQLDFASPAADAVNYQVRFVYE